MAGVRGSVFECQCYMVGRYYSNGFPRLEVIRFNIHFPPLHSILHS